MLEVSNCKNSQGGGRTMARFYKFFFCFYAVYLLLGLFYGSIHAEGSVELPTAGQWANSECKYTAVMPGNGNATQTGFAWWSYPYNAYANSGVLGSSENSVLGMIDVSETYNFAGSQEVYVQAQVGSLGSGSNRLIRVQLPSAERTIGEAVVSSNWQIYTWQHVGDLSYPQTARLLAQGGSDDILMVKFLAIIRCKTDVPPTATSTPTPTQTLIPTSTPTATLTPSPTPTPVTALVSVPAQGYIASSKISACRGVAYVPSVRGHDQILASENPNIFSTSAEVEKVSEAACMIAPIQRCNLRFEKVWDVLWEGQKFGDMWVCGEEPPAQVPVVAALLTTSRAMPQAGFFLLGGYVLYMGFQQYAQYSIQNLDGNFLPSEGLVFDTVENAKNWITGMYVHPVTIGSSPQRIEQYREEIEYGGRQYATIRWYNEYLSGSEFSVLKNTGAVTSNSIAVVQILTGNGFVTTGVDTYRIERGYVAGAQIHNSVYSALRGVFATEVVMPEPVAEAPEVPHVLNHPRPAEIAKKIAGWRTAFREWLNGGDPGWCGSRSDGAILIVFYKLAIEKTTGGLYKGIALILHTNGSSLSTVLTEVKPSDGDENGKSKPRAPTLADFHEIPCPTPFVPAQ